MKPHDESRTFTHAGQTFTIRVDNADNENGSTNVYASCPQWNVWNDRYGRQAGQSWPFPIVPMGGFTDPEAAFQAAIDATAAGLAKVGQTP